jgi:Golgi SNAP receptor complex protein 2
MTLYVQQRSELLAQTHIAPDARRRYGIASPTTEADTSASPFRTPPAPGAGMREAHLLREHTFAQTTSAQLDDFIAQSRGVLDSLVDQRQVLKGTRRRLLDAANTLGLSRLVIGWVERRRSVSLTFCMAIC